MLFDLRDVCRGLIRDRFYSAVSILTLALTIGATTAVFSIVNGVLLKPLAYREAHRLVAVREIWREFSNRASLLEVNEQHFEYWRAHARTFESLAEYIVLPGNLTGAGDAAQIAVVHTSGSLFDVLQAPTAIGRTLTPEDERNDRPNVVVLGESLWRQRFGADPGIVGRPVVIDGKPRTVVGVMPAAFQIPDRWQLTTKVDAFIPIRLDEDQVGWVGEHNNDAIGRLRAGTSTQQATAELDVLQAQVSIRATSQAHEPVTLATSLTPLNEAVVGRARRGLLLLLGAIVAVLLVACSNLANLSLTRTMSRLRDAAIRSALGASRERLISRAILEQVLLSMAGASFGLWIAWAAIALFVRTAPIDLPRVDEVTLDGRVLAFAAALSIGVGLLIAVLPAKRTARGDVQSSLKPGGLGSTSDRSGLRTRAALLAAQVALSVALLVVTALLTASFVRVMRIDRGFSVEHVLAVDLSLPASRYAEERERRAVYDRLLGSIDSLPGVERATTMSVLPLTGSGQVNYITAEGSTRPLLEEPTANFRFVAPDFFRTLGIPLRRGRAFADGERDPKRPAPTVISEPVAARLWPGEDPIGKRFSRGQRGEQGFEVVGVVADIRLTSLERTPPLMVYVPYWWRSRASVSMLVRSAVDPVALVPAIRQAVRQVDPDIAIGQTRPLEQLVDRSLSGRRYQMRLFIAFGAVALLIATIGVYAVTAYGVSRRRREMNIRVALGAQKTQVVRMIVRQGFSPVLAGLAGGSAGAAALGAIVASLLFEVRARDPFVIAGVTLLVGTVALGACLLAARQGLSINPAAALREE